MRLWLQLPDELGSLAAALLSTGHALGSLPSLNFVINTATLCFSFKGDKTKEQLVRWRKKIQHISLWPVLWDVVLLSALLSEAEQACSLEASSPSTTSYILFPLGFCAGQCMAQPATAHSSAQWGSQAQRSASVRTSRHRIQTFFWLGRFRQMPKLCLWSFGFIKWHQ